MSTRARIADWWAARPTIDLAGALMAAGAATALPAPDPSTLADILGGIAGFAGLILAAATLAFQMMSQTSNPIMAGLVKRNRRLLNRNWKAILHSTVLGGAGALTLILLLPLNARLAMVAGVMIGALVTIRGLRAVHWFVLMNNADELADRLPPQVPAPAISIRRDNDGARQVS